MFENTTNKNECVSAQFKAILGIVMMNFAAGFTADWGVICPYILSYYYFNGAPVEIKSQTSSLLMILLVGPVALCLIFSAKICSYYGHVNVIRVSAVVFLFAPLGTFLSFDFVTFALCNLILPCSAFAMSLVPMFACMYSYAGKNKSLVTALAIGSLSIGAICWNLGVTIAINPENIIPDIETDDPNLLFFTQDISQRVPKAINFSYLLTGIFYVLGSLMVSYNS